ncbi:hypothetical protein BN946_scf185001.g5 [Trametes cinnabarina]|uniref:F-box domain-containing protein n=1 Tax=Pycnoporus cinnabarinus TaxID=5643 RepID=A0A060SJU2_PYCCI|nr:hypothetical protein BN946_scf185001.g5 [Trametes cinnabarina]
MLAEPRDANSPAPLWPRSLNAQYEWRELLQLAVAHPCPQDELYSHLPDTLLDLALRCWPRHYKHHTMFKRNFPEAGARWSDPLLASSEMLHILRKIRAPGLTYLDLEFRADSGDEQLFRHIGSVFPALKGLMIHRYRGSGEEEPPLVNIASYLARLQHLEVLMLHLDFADLPDVDICTRFRRRKPGHRSGGQPQLSDSFATLKRAANTLAGLLGPALLYVCLLRPLRRHRQQWVPFHIVRSDGAEAGTGHAFAEECQTPLFDDFILPHGHKFSIYEDD